MARINGTDDGTFIFGTWASDTIEGGAGNDTIDSRGGANLIYGDRIDGPWPSYDGTPQPQAPGSNTIWAGGGNDTIIAGFGADGACGGEGDDQIIGWGSSAGAPRQVAATLVDLDRGDWLDGASGSDTVSGGGGNDTLHGGNGDDRLVGGAGADWLDGGGGADTFVFAWIQDPALRSDSSTIAGRDTISDFGWGGPDRIDLTGYGLFADGAAFLGADADWIDGRGLQVRYSAMGDDTLVEIAAPQFSSPSGPVASIVLLGRIDLTETDFVFG